MERPVSFAPEDIRDEKVRTNGPGFVSQSRQMSSSALGQSSPLNPADRKRGHAPRPVCGRKRETWLPR